MWRNRRTKALHDTTQALERSEEQVRTVMRQLEEGSAEAKAQLGELQAHGIA